jgi:hypothetical protein
MTWALEVLMYAAVTVTLNLAWFPWTGHSGFGGPRPTLVQ